MTKQFGTFVVYGALAGALAHGGLAAIREAEPPTGMSVCDRTTYALLFSDEAHKREAVTELRNTARTLPEVRTAAKEWLAVPEGKSRLIRAYDVWRACGKAS